MGHRGSNIRLRTPFAFDLSPPDFDKCWLQEYVKAPVSGSICSGALFWQLIACSIVVAHPRREKCNILYRLRGDWTTFSELSRERWQDAEYAARMVCVYSDDCACACALIVIVTVLSTGCAPVKLRRYGRHELRRNQFTAAWLRVPRYAGGRASMFEVKRQISLVN